MALSAFSVAQSPPLSSSRTVHHSRRKPVLISSHSSPPPLPQPLTTKNPLSVPVDLPGDPHFPFSVLDISHQQNHMLCGLSCLTSLTIIFFLIKKNIYLFDLAAYLVGS